MADTVAYTHLARAGHLYLLEKLAPHGIVVVPTYVNTEIENGRDGYASIPPISELPWVTLAVLDDDEDSDLLCAKANLGGTSTKHLGECAVIAVANRRGGVAVLDDRGARTEADAWGVPHIGTMWIVVEAYKTIFDQDRARAEEVVDDLLATGMRLPVTSGEELFAWAYHEGYLP